PIQFPGPAMARACGQQAVNTILTDGTMPIESVPFSSSASCKIAASLEVLRLELQGNPFLCRGALFADNASPLQRFTPCQRILFKTSIPIPHEGPCNVSVVNTATNTIFGQPLMFNSYADERLAKSITPLFASRCREVGKC
ncbi:hypothetical protein B0T20DRAFT_345512, partial [Sordaria brevicollis]